MQHSAQTHSACNRGRRGEPHEFATPMPVRVRLGAQGRVGNSLAGRGGRSQEADGGDFGRPEDRDREWDMGQPNPDFEHDFGNDDEPRDWDPKISGFTYIHIEV